MRIYGWMMFWLMLGGGVFHAAPAPSSARGVIVHAMDGPNPIPPKP